MLAAETGHLDLAYDYLCETAMLDLADLAANTGQGLHIAALAGAWSGVVAGFGGLRHLTSGLAFAPKLPPALTRIVFTIRWRDRRLRVEIGADHAVYRLLEGPELHLYHHGNAVTVPAYGSTVYPIPTIELVEPLVQPVGREPLARRLSLGAT